jgi:hypothetical protein
MMMVHNIQYAIKKEAQLSPANTPNLTFLLSETVAKPAAASGSQPG